MADLCLVSLPTMGRAKSTILPHWILWLAGYIEKQGYKVDVIDVKSDVNKNYSDKEKNRIFDETVEKAISSQSPLIGLSAFTEDYQTVMKLAEVLKDQCSAKIVVGGIHATVSPKDFFIHKDSPIDFAVVGDGEVPLKKLMEIEKHSSDLLENINGIVFRKNNDIVSTKPQLFFESIDKIPLNIYKKLDMNFYLQPQQFLLRSIYLSGLHIFTARGCPYSCTFCANRRKKVRYRPISSVIEELQYLKEAYDIDGFYIHDDTFTIKTERVIDFCEQLMKMKHKFVWGMEARVNQFSDETLRMLKKSGCLQIDFGVESGSQDSLDRMKKGIKVKDTEYILRRCREENIRTYANILINTPEETEEDLKKTIDLMENIKADSYGICVTTPYPGTEIYEHYVNPPLTVEEYQLYKDNKSYVSIVDPRFRLAKHKLDVDAISAELGKKFMTNKTWQIISLNPTYLKAIVTSARRSQYFAIFIYRFLRKLKNVFTRPMHYSLSK